MRDDAELLRCYVETNSEEAFRTLVAAHLDFVFATALRRLNGDAHLAEEVTQTVFSDLARKAATLVNHPVLRGWLHRSTHYAALNAGRAEFLRIRRESEAVAMNEPQRAQVNPIGWPDLRPVVDSLLDRLNDRERTAVILRFFEGRSFGEVGSGLRLTEDAARMLVSRALEKLRAGLARRGVTSTTAALAVALSGHVSVAAPAGLLNTVAGAALAGTAVHGTAAALGTFFAMSKIKVGIVGVIAVAGLATAVVEVRAHRDLRAEIGALRAGPEDIAAVEREHQRLTANLRQRATNDPAFAELGRLRARAATLAARPAGVLDTEFKPASSWQNAGRATPAAANETFHWALFTGNAERVAEFVVFRDDTPENRAAFMAQCSEAIRHRYPTPERVVAAGFFGAGSATVKQDPNDSFQPLEEDDHVGGDGTRFGQKHLRVWYRMASGREFEGSTRWQPTENGWALGAFELGRGAKPSDSALGALANLDPMTGDRLPSGK